MTYADALVIVASLAAMVSCLAILAIYVWSDRRPRFVRQQRQDHAAPAPYVPEPPPLPYMGIGSIPDPPPMPDYVRDAWERSTVGSKVPDAWPVDTTEV